MQTHNTRASWGAFSDIRKVAGGHSIVHETQHVRMEMEDLTKNQTMRSADAQHTLMRATTGDYFIERMYYLMQYRQHYQIPYGNNYIDKLRQFTNFYSN
jgi:hypothetical protein